jgi:hypothetical protein
MEHPTKIIHENINGTSKTDQWTIHEIAKIMNPFMIKRITCCNLLFADWDAEAIFLLAFSLRGKYVS